MLRKIRIVLSITLLVLITLKFVDFAGIAPQWIHNLMVIQFIPALLAWNWVILIVLVVTTLLFGRIYCSSVCPLGIFQDVTAWIRKKTASKRRKKRYRYLNPITWLRWGFVAATLVGFIAGFHLLVGLLDPYSSFGRMAVHVFRPIYMAGNNLVAQLYSDGITFYKVSIYLLSLSSLVVSLVTMAIVGILAWRNGRIYCNTVCPVGTVLGVFSQYSLMQIRFDNQKCTLCGSCSRNCKASCIDFKNMTVDASRCINCFNCIESCKESGLQYRWKRASVQISDVKANTNGDNPQHTRRRFFASLAVVAVAVSKFASEKILNLGPKVPVRRDLPIMPPGAIDIDNFSTRCTSCHLCVSKCPTKVIQPALLDYGLSGMMQPMLEFNRKFCNYNCTICTEVCPTGALMPITREEKRQLQIGVVQLYLQNCIVYTDKTSCGACSEHCPTQAVSMVHYKDSLTIPYIKPEICVGCGGCEYICPSKPWKAIYVEGITSHKTITLPKDEIKDIQVDDFGF